MLPRRDLPQNQTYIQAESEKMGKIFHAYRHEKEAEAAIFVSNKRDFKTKSITRDKVGHYIILKGWRI